MSIVFYLVLKSLILESCEAIFLMEIVNLWMMSLLFFLSVSDLEVEQTLLRLNMIPDIALLESVLKTQRDYKYL